MKSVPDLKIIYTWLLSWNEFYPENIIYELEHNGQELLEGIDTTSTEKAINFYKQFVKGDLYPTNARTAEMVKLVENSSRDVQIAFANELSIISDKAGINVWELLNW